MHRRAGWLMALLAGILLGPGCEKGVAPSQEGRAQGVVTDNPQKLSTRPLHARSASAFSGDLTTDAFVSLSVDGTTWVDLGSPNGITIKLQTTADSTNVHGEQGATIGTYTRIRLIMRDSEATIKAGSTIDTLTLTSDAKVKVGGTDQEVVIEKSVAAFQVRSDTSVRTTILFELNAEQWITEQSIQAGVVEDAAVQQATTVGIRTDPR